MTDALILRHDADAIATLTLNAPGSLNALSTPMLLALDAALAAVAAGEVAPDIGAMLQGWFRRGVMAAIAANDTGRSRP